jgi:hypothetical protein
MRRQWNYGIAFGLAVLGAAPLQAGAQARPTPVTAVSQLLSGGGGATKYAVEATTSAAWWQMNPNYGHLWATTCPADPDWSAGEGHGNGFAIKDMMKKTRVSAYMDYRIPLYPRINVAPVCRRAVKGEITLRNAGDIGSARGVIEINADSLETGSSMRNTFQKKSVFGLYNRITFTLDSIGDFEQAGDTLKAIAKGSWVLHGVTKPLYFPIVLVKQDAGIRVQGKTATFPRMLIEEYKMSKFALGAGVGMNLWKELHFGFDLIFKPAPGSSP